MSIKGQGHSFTLVKVHSDFKVKCLTFGLYTQVSDSGPLGPLVIGLLQTQEGIKQKTAKISVRVPFNPFRQAYTRGRTCVMITYVSKENNLGPGDKILVYLGS